MLAGKRRAIVIPLLVLCLLASLFYMTVWSSIDDYLGRIPAATLRGGRKEGAELAPSKDHQEQDFKADASEPVLSSTPPHPPTRPNSASLKTQQRLEKQRLKELHKLERLEHQRLKEEQRQRKAAKLQRLQQWNKEPFPALISTNNARVSRLNMRAFERFCLAPWTPPILIKNKGRQYQQHQQQQQVEDIDEQTELNDHRETEPSSQDSESEPRRPLADDVDFETYDEWIEYIVGKNSGQEQERNPEERNHRNGNNNNGGDDEAPRKSSKARQPLFLERPLRGWIANHTAILEPCDRTQHTAAHCLAYLAQDHLYLVPSRGARNYPNRIRGAGLNNARTQEDIELDINDELDPLSSSSSSSAMMHFHIFWRGPITDKLSLAAHGFLFTQPLDRARLHLWIDSTDLPEGQPEDYSQNPFAMDLVSAPLNRFIKIHAWNQEVQETNAYPSLSETNLGGEKEQVPPVALSDEARFLILHRYGGMYLDADVLLLRDMSPLYDAGMEFAYEWSNTGMYNTAILRLNRGSSVARRILDGAKIREREIQMRLTQQGPRRQQNQQGNDAFLDRSSRLDKPKHQQESKHTHNPPGTDPSSIAPPQPSVVSNVEDDSDDSLFASEPLAPSSPASIMSHRLVKRREMRPNEIYHPARLRSYLDPVGESLVNNGLTMLPTAMFDPHWLRHDLAEPVVGLLNDRERMVEDIQLFTDAFTNPMTGCPGSIGSDAQGEGSERGEADDKGFLAGPEVFFTGAYTYHWHNSWLTPIETDSWMGLMRRAYDEFLAGERPNLYGEYF
ncbi:hypothetical protein B0O80DRAFT_423108 [Mortierella sp. GBAus27b]|nr:hypothetical protein BGX31_005841 [Mortierella sp. GBA43]KAI8360513.1 hypothetical protein B0O80DRAFT_423108 [Mortierella sp. GBAus27b]